MAMYECGGATACAPPAGSARCAVTPGYYTSDATDADEMCAPGKWHLRRFLRPHPGRRRPRVDVTRRAALQLAGPARRSATSRRSPGPTALEDPTVRGARACRARTTATRRTSAGSVRGRVPAARRRVPRLGTLGNRRPRRSATIRSPVDPGPTLLGSTSCATRRSTHPLWTPYATSVPLRGASRARRPVQGGAAATSSSSVRFARPGSPSSPTATGAAARARASPAARLWDSATTALHFNASAAAKGDDAARACVALPFAEIAAAEGAHVSARSRGLHLHAHRAPDAVLAVTTASPA